MANEGLKGIRLTDIHGYDNDNYHEFYNNNITDIDELSKKTKLSANDIGANKYINHLLNEKMGADWYSSNAKGKTFAEKVGMYNALFNQPNLYMPEDNNEKLYSLGVWARQDGKSDLVYNKKEVDTETKNIVNQMYNRGDLVPSAKDDGNRFLGYRDWFAMKANQSANYSDRRRDIDRSLGVFEGIYDDEYFKGFEREEDKTSPMAERKAGEYKAKILDMLNNNPNLAYNMFVEFENNALINLDDYNNYQNTSAMPYTPNQMKDIMAEFYAKGVVQGDDVAGNWLYKKLHDTVWKNRTFGQNLKATIQGLGANIAGGTIAALGMFANAIPTVVGKIRKSTTGEGNYTPVEGVSGWSSWWYNVANNPWTKWGNNVITTGSWNTAVQEERKKTNFNPNQILREAGKESDFWNVATIMDIAQQGGFTIGATASSMLISGILRNVLGKHVSNIGRRMAMSEASKFSQMAGKSINAIGKGISTLPTAYFVAGGEAVMDADEEHRHIMEDQENYLLNAVLNWNGTNMSLMDYMINLDPLGFEGYYNKNRKIMPVVDASNLKGEVKGSASDKVLNEAMINQERQYLYEEYRRIKAQELLGNPVVQDMLRTTADRNAARILMAQTNRIAFGDMLLSNMLGGSFKESKRALQRSITGKSFGSPRVNIARDADTKMLHATAKQEAKAIAVAKATVDVLNEGFEELSQGVWSGLYRQLGDNYAAQYIANLGDERALEALSDDIWENWDATQRILKEQLLSKENWYAFALGAVSAGIGSPTIVRGAMNTYNRRNSGMINTKNTFKDFIKDVAVNYWRNPYVEALDEHKRQEAINAKETEDINNWLENHKEVASMTDAQQFYAWFVKAADAAANSDISSTSDVDYRDALMGQRIAAVLMMDRFGVNDLGGRSFRQQLKAISELELSDPEAKVIIEKARTTQNNNDTTGKTDEEIFNQVKKRAGEIYDISGKIRTARNFLNTEFGSVISENTKDAWAFEMVMQDDLAKREKSIIEDIRKIYNKALKGTDSAVTASEIENAFAKYGNKENVTQIIAALRNELANLKEQKRKDKLSGSHVGFRYRAAKRRINSLINDAQKAKKLIDTQESDVLITEDKILGLDITAMASLLSDERQKYLTPEQRREVEKFKNTKGFTPQTIRDINDANLIHQRREEFEAQFQDIMRNQSNMIYYDREVRMEAARNLLTHRLDKAIRANTYDVFEDELNKFMDSKHSVYEDLAIDDVLKNNKFYADWKKLERRRKLDKDTLGKTNVYRNLDAKSKRLIDLAYDRALRDKDTSLTHLKQILEDDEFRSLIGDRFGVDKEQTVSDEILYDVLEQINNYNSNAEAIRKYEETLRKENQQRGDEGVGARSASVQTNMSQSVYEDNADFYNEFFTKSIRRYITDRVGLSGISVKQIIEFANLFSNVTIGSTIFDRNTYLTFSVNGILEFANNALEEARQMRSGVLSDSDKVNVANTEMLADALKKIVSGVSETNFQNFLRAELMTMGRNLGEKGKILVNTFEKRENKPNKFRGFTNVVINFKSIFTPKEQEWIDSNNINDNLNELSKAVYEGKVKSKDIEFVFIKDDKLAASMGQIDDDTKPVIIAARIDDDWGINGTTYEINGNKYMYVGLLRNSRLFSTSEDNEYNILRRSTELGDKGVVLVDGNIYTAKGFTIKQNGQNAEAVNITDYVIGIVGKPNNADVSNDEVAINALKAGTNVRLVYITGGYDEVAKKSYREYTDFNGNVIKEYYSDEKKDYYYPQVGILDKNGNLAIGYVNDLKDTKLSINGEAIELLAALQDKTINWYAPDFIGSHHPITKTLFTIRDYVLNNKKGNNSESDESVKSVLKVLSSLKGKPNKTNDALSKLSEKLTDVINNRSLNFGKTGRNPKSKINFVFRVNDSYDTITFKAVEDDVNSGNVIDAVEISVDDIFAAGNNSAEARERIEKQLQKPLISSILNNERDGIRLKGDPNAQGVDKDKIYPVAKPQVQYGNLTKYDNNIYQDDAIKSVVRNNLMSFRAVDKGEISTNATVADSKNQKQAETKSQESIVELVNIITRANMLSERGNPTTDGKSYMGVTTSISDDDISQNNPENKLKADIASSFGTTIDKAFRVFTDFWVKKGKDESVDDLIEKTLEWFNENTKTSDPNSNGWHGLPGVDENNTKELLRQFHKRVIEQIEGRGETIISGEFYFRSTLERAVNNVNEVADLSMVPDLITVDEKGYHIYDFKTFHRTDNQGGGKFYSKSSNSESSYIGLPGSKIAKWQKQLSLYQHIIHKVTGKDIASLEIIPISLSYNTDVEEQSASSGYTFDKIGNGVRMYKQKRNGKLLKLNFEDKKNLSFVGENFISIEPLALENIPGKAWQVVNNPTGIGLRQNAEERSNNNKPTKPESTQVNAQNTTDDNTPLVTPKPIDGTMDSNLIAEQSYCGAKPNAGTGVKPAGGTTSDTASRGRATRGRAKGGSKVKRPAQSISNSGESQN